jgi:hypothetical protein
MMTATTNGGYMNRAQIWSNVSGLWFGQLMDPWTGARDALVFTAKSRGSVIAEMRYRLPLTHLIFEDRIEPTDP